MMHPPVLQTIKVIHTSVALTVRLERVSGSQPYRVIIERYGRPQAVYFYTYAEAVRFAEKERF